MSDELRDKRIMMPPGIEGHCAWCEEAIAPSEEAELRPHIDSEGSASIRPWHVECAGRSFVGSAGHILGLCNCYGGSIDDPPLLTRREGARAALALSRAGFLPPLTERKGSP